MRIALAGPVQLGPLRPWLDASVRQPEDRLSGTPVTSLACELLRRGHDVVIATLLPGVPEPVTLSGARLVVHAAPTRPRHRARDAFAVERGFLREALAAERPDLVHAHWSYEYALAALATRGSTLVTVRDWAPTVLRHRPDPYRAVRLLMNVRVLVKGRHFTVASPYMEAKLRGWRIGATVIPNGLDESAFQERTRPPNAEAVLLAVTNGFDARKNTRTLLESFAGLRRTHAGWRLVLVGAGHGAGGPAAGWAGARGLTDGVEFAGPVEHARLFDLMDGADVLVHPAREESFGMVLVEAMARGLPVIGGRASGAVPWVLDEGHAGLLADVTSADALARSIETLLGDEPTWWRYARAGYDHARRTFELAAVTQRYEDEYRRVLAAD